MKKDIHKIICEHERIGSSNKSNKTRLKLNPGLDYDSYEIDWGPTFISSARHRQKNYKTRNIDTNILERFLEKSVGRLWDDVYSELCQQIDSRTFARYEITRSLYWLLESNYNIPWYSCHYLYVDSETGLLRQYNRQSTKKSNSQIESIHWYGNVWFKLHTLKHPSVCGCVHFKILHRENSYYWQKREPEVCIHGNQPTPYPLWYVEEYTFHDPDDIYKLYRYETCTEKQRSWYNIKEPGDTFVKYYRDYPEKLKIPQIIRKKVANKNELKMIAKVLTDAKL